MKPEKNRFAMKAALALTLFTLLAFTAGAPACRAEDKLVFSQGQVIYVPAYTYVYTSSKGAKFPLTATLMVHNTDLANPLTLVSLKYYDGQGRLVRNFLDKPVKLAPLAAFEQLVRKPRREGGAGSSFVIHWKSKTPISSPLVECIMIGAQGQQGISYRSTGWVIR